MKLNEEQKQAVYQQIREFNQTPIDPNTPDMLIGERRFYVSDDVATASGKFFKYLLDNSLISVAEPAKAIDVCFGSGNLTAHLLLESGISWEYLVLNDMHEGSSNQQLANSALQPKIVQSDISQNGLNFDGTHFNLIVFNPQIGGTNRYPGGELQWSDQVVPNLKSIAEEGHTLVFHGELRKFVEKFGVDAYRERHVLRLDNRKDLVVARKGDDKSKQVCYKSSGASFEETPCEQSNTSTLDTSRNLNEARIELEGEYGALQKGFQENPYNLGGESLDVEPEEPGAKAFGESKTKHTISPDQKGKVDYSIKNLLLKGVPGTGKSFLIDRIIEAKLGLDPHDAEHVLRINIHSGSSNADLMQGIGLTTADKQIEYKEKQGLIYDLLQRACQAPKQAFVLVLEEIQENSLNELIGDLIYLIEPEKRAKIGEVEVTGSFDSLEKLMEAYISASDGKMKYVRIPNLVAAGTVYRQMIMPDNLYIYCTSNYRDDKKIVEDNLLRRFDTLDVFPDASLIKEANVQALFESINVAILKTLCDEVHPDRFEIGHAVWMNVSNESEAVARALYKTMIELKEIREIQSADIVTILNELKQSKDSFGDVISSLLNDFQDENLIGFIKQLQAKAYPDLLELLKHEDKQITESENDDEQA